MEEIDVQRSRGSYLILGVSALLVIYNAIYWPAKFFRESISSFFATTYQSIVSQWGLITFLEFLAIISLFVDVIVRWDQLDATLRKWQLVVTSLLLIGFLTRFILGMMDLFLTGEIR